MSQTLPIVPVLEMREITKKFGNLIVNSDINLTLEKGEVHAILGENGAGKTTLMKILYGEYAPTSGEIFIKGEKVTLNSPSDAIKLGIGMVYQHFNLVDNLSVLDNLILSMEKTFLGFICRNKHRKELERLIEQYGFNIDLNAKISNISIGMQQKVEILKTLYHGADILILDEPSAVLTPQEVNELILMIRRLIKEGKSILIITHKLHEIKEVADRCTVIRRGVVINTVEVSQVEEKDLAYMMVGRVVSFDFPLSNYKDHTPLIEIKSLEVENEDGIKKVDNLNLELKHGEILGIAGVDGNGQAELIDALVGITPYKGDITLLGKSLKGKSPKEIFDSGMASIPQDRHKEGLILNYDMKSNLALRYYNQEPFSHKGILNFDVMKENALAMIERFDIRPPEPDLLASKFSGGNQQKIIIAREVSSNPEVLIAAHPTRGLDVGAIQYIYKSLLEQRDKGKGILLISFELEELISVCDRIAVIFHGKIVDVLAREDVNPEKLGLMMMGKYKESSGGLA